MGITPDRRPGKLIEDNIVITDENDFNISGTISYQNENFVFQNAKNSVKLDTYGNLTPDNIFPHHIEEEFFGKKLVRRTYFSKYENETLLQKTKESSFFYKKNSLTTENIKYFDKNENMIKEEEWDFKTIKNSKDRIIFQKIKTKDIEY